MLVEFLFLSLPQGQLHRLGKALTHAFASLLGILSPSFDASSNRNSSSFQSFRGTKQSWDGGLAAKGDHTFFAQR